MKISYIEFNNFKAFYSGRLSFDDNLTVIAGANGAGKSSVLDAINICLSWIVARIRSEEGRGNYIKEDQISVGQTSATLAAQFNEIGEVVIPNKAVRGINKSASIDIASLKEYSERKRQEILQTNFKTSIPIFAHYDVRRAVVDVPLRVSETEFGMFDAYTDSLKGAANFRKFFQWFRAEEDIENESLRENDTLTPHPALSAFRTALDRFLPLYRNIRVKRRPLRMEIDKNGVVLNISQLSDGEKIYIALIGDLCKRLTLANPTLQDPTQGEGIVLIDEMDLHLHPNCQQEITTK
jgi:predicted ATP-binding protein involved in virulence